MKIWIDGGCHNNGTKDAKAYGSYLVEGKTTQRIDFDQTIITNNQAEYAILVAAIAAAATLGIQDAVFCSDSRLVVEQVNGRWNVDDTKLKNACKGAQDGLKALGAKLMWVPRAESVEKLGH